jgi:Protein kinase domain
VPQAPLVEPLRRWDPEQVGGFVLIGRLGAGAMGQVYLARSAAGRLVAVKTIKSELAEEPDFRTRFGQEVAAARRVSGAFTAAVVAADSEADVPWLATVYVPAPSLSGLVRSCGPLPVEAVRWLAAGCAEALESIHGVGLVHRDLKPANVLVSPDGPRVIDFGVARAAERIQLTVTRGSVGTPAYMAPEQARDTRQATPASDVFSLGATLLFAATGHAPYEGETVMDVLVLLATQDPDLTGLPAELAGIVAPCLERDPRNRPTSAAVLARVSGELADGGELGHVPLAPEALQLIEEYRRLPGAPVQDGQDAALGLANRAAAASAPQSAREQTIGSRPALRGSAPLGSPGDGRGSALLGSPGDGRGSALLGSPGDGRGQRPRFAVPIPGRRAALVALASAVACAALVAAGWAIGDNVGRGSGSPGGVLAGGVSAPPGLGPLIQPPPQAGQSGPYDGPPSIAVSQPTGDGNTVFVIHGQGWPAGKRVTVALVGVGTSPIHPVADRMATFNYAINQNHEFFSGGLPPGVYTVVVTDAAGARAQAKFEVANR